MPTYIYKGEIWVNGPEAAPTVTEFQAFLKGKKNATIKEIHVQVLA